MACRPYKTLHRVVLLECAALRRKVPLPPVGAWGPCRGTANTISMGGAIARSVGYARTSGVRARARVRARLSENIKRAFFA